jgi:hypothetical protein
MGCEQENFKRRKVEFYVFRLKENFANGGFSYIRLLSMNLSERLKASWFACSLLFLDAFSLISVFFSLYRFFVLKCASCLWLGDFTMFRSLLAVDFKMFFRLNSESWLRSSCLGVCRP